MDSADNTRRNQQPNPFREATFANTATDPGDALLVFIPEFSADQPFGDPDGVVWSPTGNALPQEGDRALVAESDDGSWWVVAWWSGTQETGVSEATVDALDTRLDTLESKRTVGGTVAADGTESSPEFSVVKNATGDYTLTFTTAFASAPSVTVGAGSTAAYYVAKLFGGSAPTASSFRVLCFAPNTLASVDGEWHFVATGTP